MGRTVKATTIESIESVADNTEIKDTAKFLMSQDGTTNNVSVSRMKSLFTTTQPTDTDETSLTIDTFSTTSYTKTKTFAWVQDGTTTTYYAGNDTDVDSGYTFKDNCIAYVSLAVIGPVTSKVSLQVKTPNSVNWVTVYSRGTSDAAATSGYTILNKSFKAYSGVQIRAKYEGTLTITGSAFDITLVKNDSPFTDNGKTFALTIPASTHYSNVETMSLSGIISNSSGYFAFTQGILDSVCDNGENLTLQYSADNGNTWTNFETKYVKNSTKTQLVFNEYYVRQNWKIRLYAPNLGAATTTLDTSTGPYPACTGVFNFFATEDDKQHTIITPMEEIDFSDASKLVYNVVIPSISSPKTTMEQSSNTAKQAIGVKSIQNCDSSTSYIKWKDDVIAINDTEEAVHSFSKEGDNGSGEHTVYITNTVEKIQVSDSSTVPYYVSSLSSIEFGSKVTKLPEYSFNGCISLKSIVIPETVTNITSDYLFNGCSSLTNVKMPITSTIGQGTFYGCTNLLSVNTNEMTAMTDVPLKAFGNCISVETLDLRNVERIYTNSNTTTESDSNPFYNCKNLKHVVFDYNNYDFDAISANTFTKSNTKISKIKIINTADEYSEELAEQLATKFSVCSYLKSNSAQLVIYKDDNYSSDSYYSSLIK